MNADGTGKRRLFPGREPSWSRDGSKLAYSAAGVVSIRAVGGGPAEHIAEGFSPSWSPRGAEIAFVRGTRLLVFGLASRAERTIVDAASSCPERSETWLAGPDWSPDGGRVVFAVVCDDGRDSTVSAEIVAADGTGHRELPIRDLAATRLACSPDGARVAFVSDEAGSRVGTIRLDGTRRTAVIADADGAAYLDPDW